MKILFIIDPIEKLKAYKDTSVAMMRAAQTRGHEIFTCEANHLASVNGKIVASLSAVKVNDDDHAWYSAIPAGEQTIASFGAGLGANSGAVIMRKDPPFDAEYLYATHLLSRAETQGAKVFNRAASLRDHNEKLAILEFPQFTAPTLVSREETRLQAFIDEHKDVVFKRLDGMGGTMIFRVRHDDPNRNVIIEAMTLNGTLTVMVQRYIPDISKGDKRVLLINGKPAPFCLARIPKAGETRGNLAAGGRGVAQPISVRDREIAETIGAQVASRGLMLVGLDVIGDYLTEINVTSPTCMVEIKAQTGYDVAASFIEAVEMACA